MKILIAFSVVVALPAICPAKDYVITFVKETHKAETAGGAETAPRIYHTWAVKTEFGNKLLVLTGSDSVHRAWLREFTKDFDLFLAKVPEKDTGAFELNTVVEIDVKNLHPIDNSFLEDTDKKKKK
ncbi:MAG: hypothetical protein JEZ11_14265 [Desulfobacterales bacterium]|nr:hypothetical protein [Desulfobacterales bacterium]